MRSKHSCPVWGEGAGKVPSWQLVDALLYRSHGSVRGAQQWASLPRNPNLPLPDKTRLASQSAMGDYRPMALDVGVTPRGDRLAAFPFVVPASAAQLGLLIDPPPGQCGVEEP